MDNYNKVKEATTNKVRFSITPEGKIEFDAEGLDEWQLTDAIQQATTQAREQRRSTQKLKEVAAVENVTMHCLAIAFLIVVTTVASFSLSRVISGIVHQGEVQNVQPH